ncbi:hypothetical protein L596_006376 [Steinernema carpocapsae]|uniref:Uncharacterized protein n=1 Tax=Steinernema carpocapsae TaxID=34508 RepID=A0A4U8V1W1_STECR|nr:hypothetical protein L596_006376 [Steinernema carpocapsae]
MMLFTVRCSLNGSRDVPDRHCPIGNLLEEEPKCMSRTFPDSCASSQQDSFTDKYTAVHAAYPSIEPRDPSHLFDQPVGGLSEVDKSVVSQD